MTPVRTAHAWTLGRSDRVDDVEVAINIDLLDDGRVTHQTLTTPTPRVSPNTRARLTELAAVTVTGLAEWLGELRGSDAYALHLRFPDEVETWPHGGAAPSHHRGSRSEIVHTDDPAHNAIASSYLAWSLTSTLGERGTSLLCEPDWRALDPSPRM
ncbi:hypothetical protein C8046_14065 [Serinibacter arcticus]|uniref:Uncharacterized protein n=1 Tax=Serinibacter arcticus TaxID=1655435 RepID=A0A2U1ZX99_9MICO|nr:hypothetical protein [Serinibacter arcticus]PWD51601.1 hypothetical protein C8046_14065 [Serinibacter arcticus]